MFACHRLPRASYYDLQLSSSSISWVISTTIYDRVPSSLTLAVIETIFFWLSLGNYLQPVFTPYVWVLILSSLLRRVLPLGSLKAYRATLFQQCFSLLPYCHTVSTWCFTAVCSAVDFFLKPHPVCQLLTLLNYIMAVASQSRHGLMNLRPIPALREVPLSVIRVGTFFYGTLPRSHGSAYFLGRSQPS